MKTSHVWEKWFCLEAESDLAVWKICGVWQLPAFFHPNELIKSSNSPGENARNLSFFYSVMWNSKSLRQEGGSTFGGLWISVLSAWSDPQTCRGVALHKPPSFKRKCLLSSDGCNSMHCANKIIIHILTLEYANCSLPSWPPAEYHCNLWSVKHYSGERL